MLPACRTEGAAYAMPTFDRIPSDVEGFLDDLWEFQAAFHDGFARSEPRAPCFDDMVGPWSPLERKSIEPMVLSIAGGPVRGLQRFLSEVAWDEEPMRWHDHQLVAATMGEPDGVLRCAATGLVNKGHESVGVARQYGGRWGKGEHGPVGVCAG